jgi:hypothetical protein
LDSVLRVGLIWTTLLSRFDTPHSEVTLSLYHPCVKDVLRKFCTRNLDISLRSFATLKWNLYSLDSNCMTLQPLHCTSHANHTSCPTPDILHAAPNKLTVICWIFKFSFNVILLPFWYVNPLNAELNPICHMLALGAHHILHVRRIRVNTVAVDKGSFIHSHNITKFKSHMPFAGIMSSPYSPRWQDKG